MNTPSSTNFVNIGERTNVTGSARFKKLILNDDYEAAVDMGSAAVKIAQVKKAGNSWELNMARLFPVPEGSSQAAKELWLQGIRETDAEYQVQCRG